MFKTKTENPGVLLVDPNPVTRYGFREALTVSPLCIGEIIESEHISNVPKLLDAHRSDIIIMELTGGGESVLDALRMIGLCTRQLSRIPVVVCTEILHVKLFNMLRALGVNGICMKQEPVATLIDCVGKVLAGKQGNSETVMQLLSSEGDLGSSLTEKELKVLGFIFDGKSVTATAKLMSRDVRTVSSHKRNAMTKLGFKNDSEMFLHAKWLARNCMSY